MNFFKKNITLVYPLMFIGLLVVALSANIRSKNRVLFLHSYHPEYAWTRDVTLGWKRKFNERKATVKYHYMNTKRFSDPDSKRRAAVKVLKLINLWNPDIIVAVDDDAQFLVGSKFVNDPDIDIVYAGVNNNPKVYGYYDSNNIYGIKENMVLTAFNDLLNQYRLAKENPDKPLRIAHLSDSSSFSKSIINDVRTFDWSPNKVVFSLECFTFKEWQQGLMKANREADLVLLTNYHTLSAATDTKDNSQPAVPANEVMKWALQTSQKPIFGTWGYVVEDGGMMALSVSPYEQGEAAAKFTTSIIDGEFIPYNQRHILNKEVLPYIRKTRIDKWNWQIPSIYESYARATGNLFD